MRLITPHVVFYNINSLDNVLVLDIIIVFDIISLDNVMVLDNVNKYLDNVM